MRSEEFAALLNKLRACAEAQAWAKGKSLSEAWATCERGDWMLWLAGRMAGKDGWPTRQQVVLAACACARTALDFVPKGELRPLRAIETAERWARGEASLQEVRADADAAYAYAYAYDAAYAAAYAAYAAAYATAAAAADAAYAAHAAASHAADAAYDAAYAARSKTLAECADIVRRELKFAALEEPCVAPK